MMHRSCAFHVSILAAGLLALPAVAPAELLFPLDGSFTLVDFCADGTTGSGPPQCPDQHNDDDSATVPLGFAFDLYGDDYATAYVNNNGNLSFGTYVSNPNIKDIGFPNDLAAMVAPFWADVDTGDVELPLGDVYQKQAAGLLVVHWEQVGHAVDDFTRANRFQVAISDGTNATMGLGNNVCFGYDGLEWSTGDLSGGTDGFGGVGAIAGVNRGDASDAALIGEFSKASADWDGPFGGDDGIGFLDGQTICFSTAVDDSNIAPIPVRYPASGEVAVGCNGVDPLSLVLGFPSPEAGQVTSVSVDDLDGAQSAGLTIQTLAGNTGGVAFTWAPDCADAGSYRLDVTATDNAPSPAATERRLTVVVDASRIFSDDFEDGDAASWSSAVGL